jgi:LPXTG-site transpeptidase (sortase) family protein
MLRKIVFFVVAAAAVIFVATLVHAVWYAPDLEVTSSAAVSTTTAARIAAGSQDYPQRLSIPKLNIDANVQRVGIAKSGNVAVPSNFTDVAWYKYGALPGQAGSAVFDGHVDNGLSLAGVFKHLADIAAGDDIYIQTENGTMLHYVVSGTAEYPYQEVPMADLTSTTGAPRLALITCEGAWVQGQRTYDHRLVVYANLVT